MDNPELLQQFQLLADKATPRGKRFKAATKIYKQLSRYKEQGMSLPVEIQAWISVTADALLFLYRRAPNDELCAEMTRVVELLGSFERQSFTLWLLQYISVATNLTSSQRLHLFHMFTKSLDILGASSSETEQLMLLPIIQQLRILFEAESDTGILHEMVRALLYLLENHIHQLQTEFIPIADALIGRLTSDQLERTIHLEILKVVLEFKSLWNYNTVFSMKLLNAFPVDIEQICHNKPQAQSLRLDSLIICFLSIARTLPDSVLPKAKQPANDSLFGKVLQAAVKLNDSILLPITIHTMSESFAMLAQARPEQFGDLLEDAIYFSFKYACRKTNQLHQSALRMIMKNVLHVFHVASPYTTNVGSKCVSLLSLRTKRGAYYLKELLQLQSEPVQNALLHIYMNLITLGGVAAVQVLMKTIAPGFKKYSRTNERMAIFVLLCLSAKFKWKSPKLQISAISTDLSPLQVLEQLTTLYTSVFPLEERKDLYLLGAEFLEVELAIIQTIHHLSTKISADALPGSMVSQFECCCYLLHQYHHHLHGNEQKHQAKMMSYRLFCDLTFDMLLSLGQSFQPSADVNPEAVSLLVRDLRSFYFTTDPLLRLKCVQLLRLLATSMGPLSSLPNSLGELNDALFEVGLLAIDDQCAEVQSLGVELVARAGLPSSESQLHLPGYWKRRLRRSVSFRTGERPFSMFHVKSTLDYLMHPSASRLNMYDYFTDASMSREIECLVQISTSDLVLLNIDKTAKLCVDTRLRTYFGGAAQTFAKLEEMLEVMLKALQHSRASSSGEAHSTVDVTRARFLLEFVRALERYVNIAGNDFLSKVGSRAGQEHSYPVFHQSTKQFFQTNHKVCVDWFRRIRPLVVQVSTFSDSILFTYHYSKQRVQDLERKIRQTAQDPHQQHGLVALILDLDSALYTWSESIVQRPGLDSIAGIRRWSTAFLTKMQAQVPQLACTSFVWMKSLEQEAAGDIDAALSELLSVFDEISTNLTADRIVKRNLSLDSLRGMVSRIVNHCITLNRFSRLKEFDQQVQGLRQSLAEASSSDQQLCEAIKLPINIASILAIADPNLDSSTMYAPLHEYLNAALMQDMGPLSVKENLLESPAVNIEFAKSMAPFLFDIESLRALEPSVTCLQLTYAMNSSAEDPSPTSPFAFPSTETVVDFCDDKAMKILSSYDKLSSQNQILRAAVSVPEFQQALQYQLVRKCRSTQQNLSYGRELLENLRERQAEKSMYLVAEHAHFLSLEGKRHEAQHQLIQVVQSLLAQSNSVPIDLFLSDQLMQLATWLQGTPEDAMPVAVFPPSETQLDLVSQINECFQTAIRLNPKNVEFVGKYSRWCHIQASETTPSPLKSYYEAQAIRGYFQYLQLSSTSSADTTTAALRLLQYLVSVGDDHAELFDGRIQEASSKFWTAITPQLFSQLKCASNPVISRLLQQLVKVLALQDPEVMVYPLSVCSSDVSHVIQSEVRQKWPELLTQVECFVHEFQRMSVLWEEQWIAALSRAHTNVQRHYKTLEKQRHLPKPKKTKTKSTRQVLATNLQDLQKLWTDTCEKQTQEIALTPHEQQFVARFSHLIDRTLNALAATLASDAEFDAGRSWYPFKRLLQRLEEHYPASSQLKLKSISPLMAQFGMSTNVAIPIPGGAPASSFHSIAPVIRVLKTKTKPKQFTFRSKNGDEYQYILKGREDLRLDERVMQFLHFVNDLITRERDPVFAACSSDSSRMPIRPYPVIPLSQHAGLIQMVPDVVAIYELYQQWYYTHQGDPKGPMNPSALFYDTLQPYLKQATGRDCHPLHMSRSKWPVSAVRSTFEELAAANRECNVLEDAFVHSSECLADYLSKQQVYVSTYGVMSIVGHVIGLGDRHLDNILVNLDSGQILHIDFNVCFDKGRDLKVPETIPFRLTPVFTRALGVAGVTGRYQDILSSTLGLMQENAEPIESLFHSLVHDPLAEWVDKRCTLNPQRENGRDDPEEEEEEEDEGEGVESPMEIEAKEVQQQVEEMKEWVEELQMLKHTIEEAEACNHSDPLENEWDFTAELRQLDKEVAKWQKELDAQVSKEHKFQALDPLELVTAALEEQPSLNEALVSQLRSELAGYMEVLADFVRPEVPVASETTLTHFWRSSVQELRRHLQEAQRTSTQMSKVEEFVRQTREQLSLEKWQEVAESKRLLLRTFTQMRRKIQAKQKAFNQQANVQLLQECGLDDPKAAFIELGAEINEVVRRYKLSNGQFHQVCRYLQQQHVLRLVLKWKEEAEAAKEDDEEKWDLHPILESTHLREYEVFVHLLDGLKHLNHLETFSKRTLRQFHACPSANRECGCHASIELTSEGDLAQALERFLLSTADFHFELPSRTSQSSVSRRLQTQLQDEFQYLTTQLRIEAKQEGVIDHWKAITLPLLTNLVQEDGTCIFQPYAELLEIIAQAFTLVLKQYQVDVAALTIGFVCQLWQEHQLQALSSRRVRHLLYHELVRPILVSFGLPRVCDKVCHVRLEKVEGQVMEKVDQELVAELNLSSKPEEDELVMKLGEILTKIQTHSFDLEHQTRKQAFITSTNQTFATQLQQNKIQISAIEWAYHGYLQEHPTPDLRKHYLTTFTTLLQELEHQQTTPIALQEYLFLWIEYHTLTPDQRCIPSSPAYQLDTRGKRVLDVCQVFLEQYQSYCMQVKRYRNLKDHVIKMIAHFNRFGDSAILKGLRKWQRQSLGSSSLCRRVEMCYASAQAIESQVAPMVVHLDRFASELSMKVGSSTPKSGKKKANPKILLGHTSTFVHFERLQKQLEPDLENFLQQLKVLYKTIEQFARESEASTCTSCKTSHVNRRGSTVVAQVLKKIQTSVADEVVELISQATDVPNLATMYEGWMAWV